MKKIYMTMIAFLLLVCITACSYKSSVTVDGVGNQSSTTEQGGDLEQIPNADGTFEFADGDEIFTVTFYDANGKVIRKEEVKKGDDSLIDDLINSIDDNSDEDDDDNFDDDNF